MKVSAINFSVDVKLSVITTKLNGECNSGNALSCRNQTSTSSEKSVAVIVFIDYQDSFHKNRQVSNISVYKC